jgi:hypothetical protein
MLMMTLGGLELMTVGLLQPLLLILVDTGADLIKIVTCVPRNLA